MHPSTPFFSNVAKIIGFFERKYVSRVNVAQELKKHNKIVSRTPKTLLFELFKVLTPQVTNVVPNEKSIFWWFLGRKI